MFTHHEQRVSIYILKKVNKMEIKDNERELLQNALEALQKTTGLNTRTQYGDFDFDVVLYLKLDKKEWKFPAEVKKRVTPGTLGTFVQKLHTFVKEKKGILATWHVTPNMADRMKEMGIQFIDTAGNAYINEAPLFIFIKGNKPAEKHPMERATRAFMPKGLQVVYALLCNPDLENQPFRKIANAADAALGTVDWVIKDLKNTGHLIDAGKRGRRLIRKKQLLERWVTMYPEQLRPKLLEGRYRAPETDWWKDEDLTGLAAYWGGEVAAAKLTKYLKPQVTTIYMKERPARLLLKHKLIKDPNGNIELLKAFWNFEHELQFPNLVHPILIYADLLATRDTRNIETAGIIYEKELDRFIRED
jgi:hypothetical protein